jgi:hypothetical protein
MLMTILRFAMRPDYSIVFMQNKLETTACFVLNKEQLVVSILGQLLFGCLIIEGILILKPGLVIHGCNKGLAVLVLSLGGEMNLPTSQLLYLLCDRPTCPSTNMSCHARMLLFCWHGSVKEKVALDLFEEPASKVRRAVVDLFQGGESFHIMKEMLLGRSIRKFPFGF